MNAGYWISNNHVSDYSSFYVHSSLFFMCRCGTGCGPDLYPGDNWRKEHYAGLWHAYGVSVCVIAHSCHAGEELSLLILS